MWNSHYHPLVPRNNMVNKSLYPVFQTTLSCRLLIEMFIEMLFQKLYAFFKRPWLRWWLYTCPTFHISESLLETKVCCSRCHLLFQLSQLRVWWFACPFIWNILFWLYSFFVIYYKNRGIFLIWNGIFEELRNQILKPTWV